MLLLAWFAGLVAAAMQLRAWNDESVRTLVQIRADAVFRARMAQAHETIPREWYRSKARALLAASEKLQDDGRWMMFVPGSWPVFDDLRERLAQRIEREFSETAVDTMRRELFHRASRLTGVAQDPNTAELLMGGNCAAPPVPAELDAAGAGLRGLPEFAGVQGHLEALEQLDQAVRAMVALQDPQTADAHNLRIVVHYTLGAELPGGLSRSAAFLRSGLKPDEQAFGALQLARLRYAARCSLGKAMSALDTRFFERNDLLAAERYLAPRWARLFAAGARPLPYADTMQAVREVIAALGDEEALLAQGDYAWLYQDKPSFGPAYEGLLAQAAAIHVLGPDAVDQVRRRSALALQRFRTEFTRSFTQVVGHASGDTPLVWQPDRGRLALSPQRVALRDGLVDLLREPFMAEPAGRAFPAAAPVPLSWDVPRLEQALAVGEERRRIATDIVPRFPPAVRNGVAQIVNTQLAQRVQDVAVEAMIAPAGGETPATFDASAYRAQREQLAKVQALFTELGARGRAERLRALVARDLTERLALAEQGVWRTTLFSPRTQDFSWWQGEGSPILQAFGVADGLTLKYLLAQQIAQIDDSARQAAAYLAFADPATAATPTVARWQGMVADLARYRARSGGSLLALERWLVTLGPELGRSNCAERLSAAPAPQGADEFARRHQHIQRALLDRCAQLRSAGF